MQQKEPGRRERVSVAITPSVIVSLILGIRISSAMCMFFKSVKILVEGQKYPNSGDFQALKRDRFA